MVEQLRLEAGDQYGGELEEALGSSCCSPEGQ